MRKRRFARLRELKLDGLGWAVVALGIVMFVGLYADFTPLAAAGVIGVALAGLIFTWERQCLTGVGYRRTLGRHRAMFGEEVALSVSFVNDKLLPLTWLQVEDRVPRLSIRGGHVDELGAVPMLCHLLPLFPYQQVNRRMSVVCDRRGAHLFGPASLRSGDPIGYGEQARKVEGSQELLVYPKIFSLAPYGIVSRVPLGAARAARLLIEDHSRPVGVREYQEGDPLRNVDWRATARSRSMMVRVFEPSASLRVAIFLDTNVPQLRWPVYDPPELEFTIAVAASVAADLSGRKVDVGLFSTGTIDGTPVAREPTSSPDTLAGVLEALARLSPLGPASLGAVMLAEASRLPPGTSILVVAAAFPESTLVALSELRRRHHSVTAVSIITDAVPADAAAGASAVTASTTAGASAARPAGMFDSLLFARYCADWQTRAGLELAA